MINTLNQAYNPLGIDIRSNLVNSHIEHFLDKDLEFASIHFHRDIGETQYHKYS